MHISYSQKWAVIHYLALISSICFGQFCPNGAPSTFAKVPSMIPKITTEPFLLFATVPGTAITAECYNRCQASDDCIGFIVDYMRASCFRVPHSESTTTELIPEKSSSYFIKVCLQVPPECSKKAWPIEFAPNSELVGYQQHVVPNVADRLQCAQLCLTGATQFRYQNIPCYSAQYQHWSKTCTLSTENRRSKPEAFAPSVQDGIDYIENLCIPGPNTPVCWHEPIFNYTLTQIDLQASNLDLNQCRERCEKEEYFNCRGYTYKNPICYLHSDDTLTAGPLVPSSQATYVEKLTCIDLRVECSASSMSITLHYKDFSGRIFSVGHSDECGVNGNNEDVTTLVLPISTDPRVKDKCGIFVAYSVGYGNRKLANAVIAVQRHPIIQTLGDRVVKVTCIAEDGTDRLPRPLFNKITLDASFGVAEPPVQTSITNEGPDISSASPIAHLRVLDLSKGGAEFEETMLGEELELRIDINPPFNTSIIRAGHLVASSGDGRESLLLLDWRGCPPDPSTFPALTPRGPQVLFALFKAFRFPSSPILRFSIIVTLCENICQPTDCGNGLSSWGRRKRSTENSTQKVPLQLAIIVRSPNEENSKNDQNVNYESAEEENVSSTFSSVQTESIQTDPVEQSEPYCLSLIMTISILIMIAILLVVVFTMHCIWTHHDKHAFKRSHGTNASNSLHDSRRVRWIDQ